MVDLSPTIVAKSDQLNADDLLGGRSLTIKVMRVTGNSDKEQPISIYFEGDDGKPYKPGKSMRRVLVNFWGKESDDYIGRSMTLVRDPNVTFGGIKVGGIRISHLSDIGGESEMALAVTKGAKKLYRVKPLVVEQQRRRRTPREQVDAYVEALKGLATLEALREYQLDERRTEWRDKLPDDLKAEVVEAQSKRAAELAPPAEEEGNGETTGGEATGAAEPAKVEDDDDGFPA